MKHNIVLGPPGTGKTTYLLNTVDKLFTDGALQISFTHCVIFGKV